MADIVHPKSPCPPHDDLGVSVGWEASYEGWPVSIRSVRSLPTALNASANTHARPRIVAAS